LTDIFLRLSRRYGRTFSAVGAIWFAFGCALYAKFLALPDLPYLTEEIVLYSGAAYNAVWWGFVRPALKRRSMALDTKIGAEGGLEPPIR